MFLQPLCYWNDLQLQITCAERWNICGYSWNSIMLILKIENHYIFRVIFEKKKKMNCGFILKLLFKLYKLWALSVAFGN